MLVKDDHNQKSNPYTVGDQEQFDIGSIVFTTLIIIFLVIKCLKNCNKTVRNTTHNLSIFLLELANKLHRNNQDSALEINDTITLLTNEVNALQKLSKKFKRYTREDRESKILQGINKSGILKHMRALLALIVLNITKNKSEEYITDMNNYLKIAIGKIQTLDKTAQVIIYQKLCNIICMETVILGINTRPQTSKTWNEWKNSLQLQSDTPLKCKNT